MMRAADMRGVSSRRIRAERSRYALGQARGQATARRMIEWSPRSPEKYNEVAADGDERQPERDGDVEAHPLGYLA